MGKQGSNGVGPCRPERRQIVVGFSGRPKRAQAYSTALGSDPDIYDLINKAITANATNASNPPASEETEKLHNELKGMRTTDRDRFANLDLMHYFGSIPAAQFQELQNDQALVQKQDPAAAQNQARLTRALVIANPVFVKAGIDPDPASENYNIAVGRLDSALSQWSANNNNKLPGQWPNRSDSATDAFPGGRTRRTRGLRGLAAVRLLTGRGPGGSPAPDDKNTDASTNTDAKVVVSQGGSESHGDENGKVAESPEKQGEPTTSVEAAGREADDGQFPEAEYVKAQLSARDKTYLDKYYDEVVRLAKAYKVDPASGSGDRRRIRLRHRWNLSQNWGCIRNDGRQHRAHDSRRVSRR